ncbi:Interleukin-17 receptor C [Bagarius yarrelli]|uniref:Interleukin-17 receptor C n=1 Tax=Bagarius yarrelli TaxID=175774 RepID=A0A556TH63_BAGYA|nr:Interleukin-17 receptor C [Bagarius yarrelli]
MKSVLLLLLLSFLALCCSTLQGERVQRIEQCKTRCSQVHIEDDCLEVSIGQDVHVTLQTWPQFCDVSYTRKYLVPDCSNKDLQGNIPECTTGKINYEVDFERREVHIVVSDMLEDRDYHVRLCHRNYICTGTGAHILLKKENPVKNVTLKFSKPVPCLCIEGWSLMTDASRIQVCPFKNSIEELWSGINFDPLEGTLSWEASCQVSAVISLCELQDQGMCQDLANSSRKYIKGKVSYTTVDPHPRLCMKDKHKHVQPKLDLDLCTTGLCIKAKRVDVKYGVTNLYCRPSCPLFSSKLKESDSKWRLTVPAMTLATAVAVTATVMSIAMIGYYVRRTIKARLPGKHTALFSPINEEVNSKTELMSTVALNDENSLEKSELPDSERSGLLNDFTNHIEV